MTFGRRRGDFSGDAGDGGFDLSGLGLLARGSSMDFRRFLLTDKWIEAMAGTKSQFRVTIA